MIERLCNPLRRMFMAMLVLWAAGSLNAVAADQPAAKPKDEMIKVVYHADFSDPRRFSAMLANIHNMVSTYQAELKEYDVRIVFVSYGIRFVTQDKLAGTPFAEDAALKQRRAELLARLATLRDTEGVKLELCEITREAVRLPKEKIISGVALVPSGVVRIVELQRQGFAYLKVE
jgi:intracellular sulfur oxidation DsrE/DsrF family protein